MVPIQEALTFDDVTLVPKYSEILPSEVDTSIKLTNSLKLKIPLLSSAMDTVTESKMAIAVARSGGLGIIHRNLDIKKQVLEVKKVKKQKLLVGAAVGAGPKEFKRAEALLKEKLEGAIDGDDELTIRTELKGGVGKYGRLLGWLYVGDEQVSLNEQMITEGYAWDYDGGTKKKDFEELREIRRSFGTLDEG